MSDDEDDSNVCPLCVEEMDLSDKNFLPCPCGYRVCMWCWHHIRENLNGLCPACRTPYNADPHAFSAVDHHEVVKKNRERKHKEKQEKKVTDKAPAVASTKTAGLSTVDRRHLHNYRVVQRNLVYVIGVPASMANEELLRKAEYFGQYGKISKVVVQRNHTASHTTVSAYVTFTHREDAKAAITALDGFWLEGSLLRASFGTTKYCNSFIRGTACSNPECVYLHDLGDDDDRFTKEEIQAGHSKLSQVPEKDQTIVTGNGGPSGTGRRPSGETVLPPPVFIQDNTPTSKAPTPRNTWGTDGKGKINGESAEMKDDLDSTSSNNNPATSSSSNRQTRANSSKLENPNSILLGNGKNISDLVEVGEMVNVTNQSSLDGGNRTEKISTDKQKSIVGTEKGIYQSEKFVAESTHPESKVMVESELLLDGKLENLSESIGDVWGGNISNGFSKSAVFPVPVSSLSISVWSGILQASPNSDLKLNPYGHLFLPFSELLNLTMPPVDAVGLSPWPKPQSYYKQPNLSLVHGNDVQSTVKKTDTVDLQSELAATTSTSSSSKGETKGMLSNEVGQTDTIHSQQATNKLLSNNINALKQIFPGINLNIGAPSRSADR